MKKLALIFLSVALLLAFTACNQSDAGSESGGIDGGQNKLIKIGTNGPHLDMMEKAKEVMEAETDYEVELVVFDDVVQPNVALSEGSIDCNFFQHKLYLKNYTEEHGADLVPYGDKGVFMLQFGLYSDKVDSVDEIEDGAQIAFGMDPSNRAIALKFLEELGLIKLEEGVETPDTTHILENPKNLEFTEVDITAVVNSIEDPQIDAAIVMGFALARSGKDPSTAIAYASDELVGDYVNVIAVREEDKDSDKAGALYEVLTGEEMAKFYDEYFKGAVKLIEE